MKNLLLTVVALLALAAPLAAQTTTVEYRIRVNQGYIVEVTPGDPYADGYRIKVNNAQVGFDVMAAALVNGKATFPQAMGLPSPGTYALTACAFGDVVNDLTGATEKKELCSAPVSLIVSRQSLSKPPTMTITITVPVGGTASTSTTTTTTAPK